MNHLTNALTIDVEATKQRIKERFGCVAYFIDSDEWIRRRRAMVLRIMAHDYPGTWRPDTFYQNLLAKMKEQQLLVELPNQTNN